MHYSYFSLKFNEKCRNRALQFLPSWLSLLPIWSGGRSHFSLLPEFDFGPNQTTHFGVTCPWVTKISHFWTWISQKPVGQSWSNFMCSIIWMGERLHKVLGQIGSKHWFPWQQKAPLTYNGENDVSTFSRLFLIWSFLYLQVTRTCIKSQMSSGQIRPLTTELAALEV